MYSAGMCMFSACVLGRDPKLGGASMAREPSPDCIMWITPHPWKLEVMSPPALRHMSLPGPPQ